MPRSVTAAAWYSCMYGVIVVPTSATARTMKSWLARKCGHRVFVATWPQSGLPRNTAIGYARNVTDSSKNTRSAYRYDPKITTDQIPTAARGTATYRETPKISNAAPIPANSDTTSPRFATTRHTTANVAVRSENCSRISETRPSPEYAPRRADISCTTTSATVTSTIKNSMRYANCDPDDAYVAIPPASLPAFAAMTPGPNTARSTTP